MTAIALTAIWLSPALVFAIGPALLTQGTLGLWLPLVAFAGFLLAGAWLADPWGRLRGRTAGDLLHHRFGWRAGRLLGAVALAVTLLFLWAQLAALREAGRWTGWPLTVAALGAGALLVLDLRPGLRRVAGAGGAVVLMAGLLLPLAALLVATDPVWPRVWDRVASQARFAFSPTSPWVVEGRAIHGVEPILTLAIGEEQRVRFGGQGRVVVRLWEGGEVAQDVDSGLELAVRAGDRLLVPNGLVLRFEPGRAIPGAPPTGPDWAVPETPRGATGRRLGGLAATLLLGGLGLPPLLALLGAGPGLALRAVRCAALLLALLLLALQLWALYAAWLAPEVYLGGIDGLEPLALPALASVGEGWGELLALLAFAGIGGGFLAAGLAALEAVRLSWMRDLRGGEASARWVVMLALGLSLLLARQAPWGGWRVLEFALGLAAATLAPVLILGLWRERLTARGAVAGLGIGLAVFVALALAGLIAGREESLPVLTRWPALVAAPANALGAWLLSAAPRPSRRSPPARAFLELHAEGLSSPPTSSTM
ncbi:MAG: hypothetical protein HYY19_02175 [Candidatus Rokubacteria bacterium]|nr:hypothetical protein [Candidatus Rokubacteria bacterium]